MNFSTMDYFVALAEKSFTKAAERLSVTQQTLSAHHRRGARAGRAAGQPQVPLTLTYAGDVFLGYARRFQALRRTVGQEFLDIAKDERGLLGWASPARANCAHARNARAVPARAPRH